MASRRRTESRVRLFDGAGSLRYTKFCYVLCSQCSVAIAQYFQMLQYTGPYCSSQGFEWYRAWIVRCNVDDTFDVRYTCAPSSSLSDTPRGTEERATREQRPEVEASTQASSSEEDWSRCDEEVKL